MVTNTSQDRRWLQVAGLPLPADVAVVRAELDKVASILTQPESSRIALFNADGKVIGALDMMPGAKARIDGELARLEETGGERQPDPAAGDTIIRPLDQSDPDHVALLTSGPRVLHRDTPEDPGAALPDYQPPEPEPVAELKPERLYSEAQMAAAIMVSALVGIFAATWF